MRILWTFALLASGLAAQETALDDAAINRVRAAVLPTAADLAWLDIPWRHTLWGAVADAKATGKPVLLWAMNGHPLGCV